MSRPFIRTQISATQMSALAKGAAFDLGANSADAAELEKIIRWVTVHRPEKDQLAILKTMLLRFAQLHSVLADVYEEAVPGVGYRAELADHAAAQYRIAGNG